MDLNNIILLSEWAYLVYYNRELVTLPMHHQIASNGQNQSATIDRYTASCVGRGFHNGYSYCFRMRCRAVLLKSKGLSSQEIRQQTEMSHISVNSWTWSPPIMDWSDEAAVRKVIEEDRQSVSKARENWQNATGEEANDWTFKRFLSVLVQDISE